eukprot:scaffold6352_cov200-Isochrysis_galbana.AAC.2
MRGCAGSPEAAGARCPQAGATLEQDGTMGAVESVKAASDVYAPVSGQVTEVNSALNDEPGLVNSAAESDGWMCKIKMSKPEEVDGLMVRGAQPQPAPTQRSPAVPTETRSHSTSGPFSSLSLTPTRPCSSPAGRGRLQGLLRPVVPASRPPVWRGALALECSDPVSFRVPDADEYSPPAAHPHRGKGGGRRMPLARGAAGCAGAVQICPARVLARPLSAPARRVLAGAALEGGWGCMS